MKTENVHRACEDYVAVDVFKGYCHTFQKMVNANETACQDFSPLPKCGICGHYLPVDDFLGSCQCQEKESTYKDLNAKTCESFKWLKKG